MKIKNIAVVGLLSTLAVFSCKKKESSTELKPASTNFEIKEELTYRNTTFTFNNEDNSNYPRFNATFNEEVNWTIRLTGLKSKAVKEFKGTGSEIKAENTIWDGASSNVYFFKAGELVDVELSIFGGQTYKGKDSILVSRPKRYHRLIQNGVKYIGIDNFEGSTDRDAIDDLKAGFAPDAADIEVEMRLDTNIVVSGNNSWYMTGNDINKNSWSGGINSERLMDFYEVASTSALLIDSGISPDKLFFNLFVYGTGREGSAIEIKVYELDGNIGNNPDSLKSRADIVNYVSDISNTFDQTQNDAYIYNFNVDWTGWKMISVPYSDFIASKDINTGGNGDRIKESFRIVGAVISLLSLPEGRKTELYVDHFFVTQGGKFLR
jgi:hypothetical protein